jgi:glycosyltransferase involved in cell wall biosynthesis
MRIVHVSESLATGVLDVVARLAAQQAELGHDVTVLYAERPETPSLSVLRQKMPRVRLRAAGTPGTGRLVRTAALYRELQRLTGDGSAVDVLHLHSSFAGLAGRVLNACAARVYSPHGFSFLRADRNGPFARLFLFAERALARRSELIIAVSAEEAALARDRLGASSALLRNVIDLEGLPRRQQPPRGSLLVVNVGRWCPQKAPERFVRAAASLSGRATFRWIGDAPAGVPGVESTGWLSADDAKRELASADILYFTSRWEGMPVGLMEAQAMGVPVVAMRCVGVGDVVLDGQTGIVVDTEDEAQRALASLVSDRARVEDLAREAWRTRGRFSSDGYGAQSVALYQQAIDARRTRVGVGAP